MQRYVMAISGATAADYVLLVGHFNYVQIGDKIDPRLRERGYTEAMIKELESRVSRFKTTVRSLNIEFTDHIENYKHPAFDQIMSLYSPYREHGLLPFPGSVSEQPAQVMDFFSVLDSLIHEREEKERQRQQREFERGMARGN